MNLKCKIEGCDNKYHAKGYCKRHYQQYWYTGSPVIKRPNPHGTPEERFWRYVDKKGADECWIWKGRKDKDGYGNLRLGNTQVRAHRYSCELHGKPLPADMMARHTCNNPCCVNPAHIVPGDHFQNMADRKLAGHYRNGSNHPMSKLSDSQVTEVRLATGTYKKIARQFGISASHVGNIRRGDQRNDLVGSEL